MGLTADAPPPVLAWSETDYEDARERKRGLPPGFVAVHPGSGSPTKNWPVERFAALAHHLITVHKLRVLINGSPGEAPLAALIKHVIALNHPEDEAMVACLPELGIKIGSLKRIVQRSCLMVTNDTGPRHIAAAFGIPCIAMFGPTDHRWTTLPLRPDSQAERVLLSDPDLPDDLVAISSTASRPNKSSLRWMPN